MKNPTLKCGKCDGSGRLSLNGVYLATLKRLGTTKRPTSTLALASHFGINHTAMCNRLTYLQRHGFVAREYIGRESYWRAA